MVGTEMLYFAVGELGLDGGIAVTASHNPKEYTGMKIVRRGALPVGGDSGLLDVRDRALALSAAAIETPSAPPEEVDIYPAFADKVLSFVDPGGGRAAPRRHRRSERDGRRHAAAGARAAPGRRGPLLLRARRHVPEPRAEPAPSRRTASSSSPRSSRSSADLGIAFDGDADRCFFVDDTGEFVPGDFVTALLAESMLEKEPGAKIIYDVRASWAVRDTIERGRRRAAREPRRPRVHQAPHARGAGRSSPARSPATTTSGTSTRPTRATIPALLMLELVSKRGKPLVGAPRAPTGSATSSPASSTRPWRTSR